MFLIRNVKIDKYNVIVINSVTTKDVPDYSVVVESTAKVNNRIDLWRR